MRVCYQLGLRDEFAKLNEVYIRDTLPHAVRSDPRMNYSHTVHTLIFEGKSKEAMAPLRESWDQFKATNDGIRLVILGQQFGDTQLRDEMLAALAASPDTDYRSQVTVITARAILAAPDKVPADEEIKKVIDSSNQWSVYAYAKLNLGWYLVASGETARGQVLLREVIDDKFVPLIAYERYMAAIALEQSGYDMDKHPWRFPGAHEWPKAKE